MIFKISDIDLTSYVEAPNTSKTELDGGCIQWIPRTTTIKNASGVYVIVRLIKVEQHKLS